MNPEYDSVVCAALLHDIGKFLQRGYARNEPHHRISGWFVSQNKVSFRDPDLVELLASHHHEGQYAHETDKPAAIKDERHRMLAYLVSAADTESASERIDEKAEEGYQPLVPMDSVFSQVDLGSGIGDVRRHNLSVLFKGDVFPHPSEADVQHNVQEYQQHFDRFLTEFRDLFPEPYDRMNDTLTYLLQKYLWCVPSDTTKVARDISLADHMKVSAALAACFYKWHEANGWTESSVRNRSLAKTYLLCGDISGIQNFIYGIASVGTGGVAKRLRGRSFRISMLTDAVAIRILHALDLPLACRIMSAGGQFYLLIPNTEADRNAASQAVRDISDWLLKSFNGEIALSVGGCEIAGDDLSQSKFDQVLSTARVELAQGKQRKFSDALGTDRVVLPLDYSGRRACSVCERRPADFSEEEEVAECEECRADRDLGRKLVSEDAWLVISDRKDGASEPLFENPTWFAGIATDSRRVASMSPIAAFNLRGSGLLPGVPCGYQLHAGYVPRKDGEDAHEIKSFEDLADASTGVKLLGVLRADVDHLGLVFTLGMEKHASLSRIATMSSMLHYFFTYELQGIIEKEFPDTYTAYAGGDDLMLIGPWDKTIELSKRISDEFRRFTAENPNITISAGIGTYKPKSPIATTSRLTGELLERSKSAGRDRLTIFDTTFEWPRFDEVREWKQSLIESLQSPDDSVSSGFVYRLLAYREQAVDFYRHGAAKSVMYRPHLAYDLARNFRDKNGNPKIDADLLEGLTDLIGADENQWSLLKAAITWCAYSIRKGRVD
ncbi:MAG: type III-A CRISPR-associated protein Cas10/Csm1 [Armatimonadetes bacterium]|nr:type III-A CRISPR-associated protein Cas10/Csm1 [Armatimonadota bacterium]